MQSTSSPTVASWPLDPLGDSTIHEQIPAEKVQLLIMGIEVLLKLF